MARHSSGRPSARAYKPGNEGPNLVIDFRPFPMGDCNYRPIVVNIAQDLNNLYIVLYKNWSQIKKIEIGRGIPMLCRPTLTDSPPASYEMTRDLQD